MPKVHHITRYNGNRRLYDKTDSRYINLSVIQANISAGDRVSIIEQNSNKEITQAVLLEILAALAWNGVQFSESVLLDWVRQACKSGAKRDSAVLAVGA